MDRIKDGYFFEKNDLWPGQHFCLQVEEVLHHETSQYQDILVFKSKNHGNVLVLDGIIQCTELDEFAYQEMISFLPLCAHPAPSAVLIVGGGDGGVAREVSRHPEVEQITQVEIDERVVQVSKTYLPHMSLGFDSPKLDLIIGDGFDYMQRHRNAFDVVITDSGDPIGPAESLFTETYFSLLKNALKPGGIACSQAGTIWSQFEHVSKTVENCSKHFETILYAQAAVPTYPTGNIGFIVASAMEGQDLKRPKYGLDVEGARKLGLRYYNKQVHEAAFVLPNFAQCLSK